MSEKHKCTREDIDWKPDVKIEAENLTFEGTCRVCGKEYHQVFIEVSDGLWDVAKQEYTGI